MESQLASIFISAILNLVTAQAPYGYQPVLYRHSLFVHNDPRLKLGTLDQFNSNIWKQQNIKTIPHIQRISGINSHRVENGVKHIRQRYGAQNNEIELGEGLGSNNPRLSPAFVEKNSALRLNVRDQLNPTFRNGKRLGYGLKYIEYNPSLKIKQASEINNQREGNGINKYKSLIHSTRYGNDEKIYDQKNSLGSGDVFSKYFKYQPQINMDTKKPRIITVDPNKPGQSLLSGKQLYNFNNIGFEKEMSSSPWNNNEEIAIKQISRTLSHIPHNKQSNSGRIRPTYVIPRNSLYKQVNLQNSNLRRFQTPEEDVSYERIGHNNETLNINNEEPKESSVPVGDTNEPTDVEDLSTEIFEDRLRAVLHLFKNQEKIKLQQLNNFDQKLLDKNDNAVTKFIIEHFTPKDMKHFIFYIKTGVENAKVHMALKNYKTITRALINFLHYSYPLTDYIQNFKIVSENKQPDSDVLTSTMEEVFAGDKSKKLSLLPDKTEARSLSIVEHVPEPLYEDYEDGNVIKNIDMQLIHNRKTLGVQKPKRYKNVERTSGDQKADYNENIEGVSKVQIAGNNENIEVSQVQKEGNNEDIERNTADQTANYSENIKGIPEVRKAGNNENSQGISEVPIAENNENIEGASENRRQGNNENIKGDSSDYQIIVDERNVENNYMKNESSVNMRDDGDASKEDSTSQIKMKTHKKVKNDNKTELELFIQNLHIHKRIEDAFCKKLNTEQAINVMESILMNFIEDLSNRFDKEIILKTADYSVNINLNAETKSQDCVYH